MRVQICCCPKFYKRTVAPSTTMFDNRCPVRLQTQVIGEDAGTDSVGGDFIKEAEIRVAPSDERYVANYTSASTPWASNPSLDVEVIDASSVRACVRHRKR